MPTRIMWVDAVDDGRAALEAHPIFQLAPLGDIRSQMPLQERRFLKSIRLAEDGLPEALIWFPRAWHREERYSLARTQEELFDPYRPQDPDPLYTPYDHWIGMTNERVWTTGGGDRDHLALGAYVHLLERLQVHGNRSPAEQTGEIPEEDEGMLGDLAR